MINLKSLCLRYFSSWLYFICGASLLPFLFNFLNYHYHLITFAVPLEFRESAMIYTTHLLLQGQNPFDLAHFPRPPTRTGLFILWLSILLLKSGDLLCKFTAYLQEFLFWLPVWCWLPFWKKIRLPLLCLCRAGWCFIPCYFILRPRPLSPGRIAWGYAYFC